MIPAPLLLRLWVTTALFRIASMLADLGVWISPEVAEPRP